MLWFIFIETPCSLYSYTRRRNKGTLFFEIKVNFTSRIRHDYIVIIIIIKFIIIICTSKLTLLFFTIPIIFLRKKNAFFPNISVRTRISLNKYCIYNHELVIDIAVENNCIQKYHRYRRKRKLKISNEQNVL